LEEGGAQGGSSEGVKEAVRQILDGIIRHSWAKAAGIVKKSFGRDEDDTVRQGTVGDSALFAGRIATLYGISERLLQEFEEDGPDRAEIVSGATKICVLDLDADTVLVAVVDLEESGHGEAGAILEDARKRLREVG
jgi:predicted regulator of Ras-like GTPase activity (Roadblock/LC7/MglB family)